MLIVWLKCVPVDGLTTLIVWIQTIKRQEDELRDLVWGLSCSHKFIKTALLSELRIWCGQRFVFLLEGEKKERAPRKNLSFMKETYSHHCLKAKSNFSSH